MDQIGRIMTSCVVNQNETISTIREYYQKHNYLLDPHSAVAAAALNEVLLKRASETARTIHCCLSTATPAKFPETVLNAIGIGDDKDGKNRALFNRFQDLKEKKQFDIFWSRDAMEKWEDLLRAKVLEISSRL
jgi:threonine synthase